MKIKCGSCGKDILVPDDLVAGQHVRCPYCDEKTAFDKPSRVALPEGFEVKRRARTRIDEMKRARAEKAEAQPAVVELPAESKPKLGVIRPTAGQAAGPDLNAEAIKRRMEEEAQGKQAANEKAAAARTHLQHEAIVRRTIGIGLLVLLVVVVTCWIGSCSRERTRRRIDALRREEQRAREEERQRQIWQEEQDKRRAEQEEKQAVEREEARKAAEARAQERAAARVAEQKAREALAAAEAQKEAERLQNVEAYKRAAFAFRTNKFSLADGKKIALAIGTRSDSFYFCFAAEDGVVPIYEVASESNGTRRVVKMLADGTTAEGPLDAFVRRVEEESYLMVHGQQVCFRSPKAKPMIGRLNIGKCDNPTEAFFGKMYPTVKALELMYDGLSFDISFQPPVSKKADREVAIGTVGFEGEVTACQVRNAVVEAFPMIEKEGRRKVKKFRRTIMFWNGTVVKQGADGITYVPRCPPAANGQAWARWRMLQDQVEAEDAAEQNYYNDAQTALDEKMSKVNKELREKWCAEIRDILKNGTLVYRAKIAKGN